MVIEPRRWINNNNNQKLSTNSMILLLIPATHLLLAVGGTQCQPSQVHRGQPSSRDVLSSPIPPVPPPPPQLLQHQQPQQPYTISNVARSTSTTNKLNQNLNKGNSQQPNHLKQQQQYWQHANESADKSKKIKKRQQNDDEYLIGVGLGDITGPAADINLVSVMRQLAAASGLAGSAPLLASSASPPSSGGGGGGGGPPDFGALFGLRHPTWRELSDVKLQLKINFKSLLLRTPLLNNLDVSGTRILYTSLDNGMISQLLRAEVLKRLAEKYGPSIYNASNVMLTASHSHSCPGGFFQYMLYNIPSAGFVRQTLEALTGGIMRSIERAHDNMQSGKIYLSSGELLDASINRSPTSYDNNPVEERQMYKHNTDTTMHLLKFVSSEGKPLAMLNWFPVHGTSMNNTNHLISSDNKGYASLLFEQEFNPPGTQVGRGKFVAIFAQANEGDVSPNTQGPRCVDSGLPCDLATSTCAGQNERCIAFGPGKDMFESTKIIAYRQYQLARKLFMDEQHAQLIHGPVRYVHEHIDMTEQVVPMYKSAMDLARRNRDASGGDQQVLVPASASNKRAKRRQAPPSASSPFVHGPVNSSYTTCPAALGYSFAAGTTDGPGAFDFQQGDTASTRYWNMVRDFLRRPSRAQIRCHNPKPILLSTGEMDFPYMWHPKVVPTQILQVGQLAIVGLPGEFTTMAGRRVRNAVRNALLQGQDREDLDLESDDEDGEDRRAAARLRMLASLNGQTTGGMQQAVRRASGHRVKRNASEHEQTPKSSESKRPASDVQVVLSGLSNIYTSYVTTLEEYEIQRYEGASTLYGPHTLQAYVNQFRKLARLLANNLPASSMNEPQPPDLTRSLFTLKPGVLFDGAPHGRQFGDALQDVERGKVYKCGELVSVAFVAGNPRNDLRHEDSFLYVDRYLGNGTWLPVATDASWETKFIWERTNTMFGESRATCQWEIPAQCEPGYYRIRHYGAHKSLLQSISQYSGQSTPFQVGETVMSELVDEQLLALVNHNGTQVGVTEATAVAVSANPRTKDTAEPAYRRGMALLSDVFKRLIR